MNARSLLRLSRTLWYMKPAQLRGQLVHALGRSPRRERSPGPPPELRFDAPGVPWLAAPPHTRWEGDRLTLIGREVHFERPPGWERPNAGPLFAFHLHQFDWARGNGPAEAKGRQVAAARLDVMTDWAAHQIDGPGWHPAPCSLRTLAWIKILTTPGLLPEDADTRPLRAALADGVATVAAHPETRLLANHYLWNLMALVFAGVCLKGEVADRGLSFESALSRELDEQVLPDGAHYERSPMYHSLLLETVLDLVNAARSAPGRIGGALESQLEDVAARMLGALRIWLHPDDQIALFGDSALGIAHPPLVLFAQGSRLRIEEHAPEPEGVLRDAGFARLEAGPFVLLLTAAVPMPEYNPGHAHCDALSFELSVGGERVVTDTGVCEYVPGARRDIARATRSHATVEVDGQHQAEFWHGHRIGGRPDVGLVSADPPHRAEAVCAGWRTPDVLHRRRFEVDAEGVRLEDFFDSPAVRARLHLPLAPGLEPSLDGALARVPLPGGGALEVSLPETARWHVERQPYYPEFGRDELRAMLVGEAGPLQQAEWRLRLV